MSDAFENALHAVVERRWNGRIGTLRRLTAGASYETWALDVVAEGATEEFILRRAPGGALREGATTTPEQEAALIQLADDAGAPVPAVRYVLQPSDGLGRGFFMERLKGETLARRILRDEQFAGARARLAGESASALAAIHRIEAGGVGVRSSTPASEIALLWESHCSLDQPRPVFEAAFRWLREHVPDPVAPRLVHGDFRLGNLLVDPQGLRGILDWELAHLGDPHEDIAWISVNSWRFGNIDLPIGGFAEREDFYLAYEAAAGVAIDRQRVKFWEVLGSLRWGLMCAGMVGWIRSGEDASVERTMIARRASEAEIDILGLIMAETAHAG
ncbi:tyrosine protein kinase:aminoglycoside phosphotransferase [Sphingobium sp. TA15]|uniref:Putative aminoglycoside phosphotransferase n=1 Tax=Sphingobium indicum (strain DSM 16413 / CCM 7287 / MTCC 6362 / UT26 / NBRC 101211 / UT26S) TaxID=452662 RepID=D4Z8F6_SPHIU|nr:phosphotransferase family protein [Sphingobium indicum]BAI98775.1 putative aminoglycoside phosphotransferase [Sphingobium indicum UT26S]BDD68822.1 tyrosine protein kinase:aminoglycoside phosphotransferase [Sphingobium sp. TA15]